MIITTEVPNKRRKVTKFALAGVAVFGVGAAATSAAWSDNVFFGAEAAAADFELQGWDEINSQWANADTNGLRIALPSTAFDTVGPDIADSYSVQVSNAGDLPIYLKAPIVHSTGGRLFANPEPASVEFGTYSGDGVLRPGEQESIDVIVTGNVLWEGSEYQGRTGTLSVRIEGSSSPITAPGAP